MATTDQTATIPLEDAADVEAKWESSIEKVAASASPVRVYDATSAGEGEILRGMLETEGIEAVYESRPGMTMVLGGDSSGSIVVPAEDEARAKELISTFMASAEVEPLPS